MNIVLYWMKWKYPKMKPKKIEVGDRLRWKHNNGRFDKVNGNIVIRVENHCSSHCDVYFNDINSTDSWVYLYDKHSNFELVESSEPAVKKSEEESGWGF